MEYVVNQQVRFRNWGEEFFDGVVIKLFDGVDEKLHIIVKKISKGELEEEEIDLEKFDYIESAKRKVQYHSFKPSNLPDGIDCIPYLFSLVAIPLLYVLTGIHCTFGLAVLFGMYALVALIFTMVFKIQRLQKFCGILIPNEFYTGRGDGPCICFFIFKCECEKSSCPLMCIQYFLLFTVWPAILAYEIFYCLAYEFYPI